MLPSGISQVGIVRCRLQVIFPPDTFNGRQVKDLVIVWFQGKILVERKQGVGTHDRIVEFQQCIGKLGEDVLGIHSGVKL